MHFLTKANLKKTTICALPNSQSYIRGCSTVSADGTTNCYRTSNSALWKRNTVLNRLPLLSGQQKQPHSPSYTNTAPRPIQNVTELPVAHVRTNMISPDESAESPTTSTAFPSQAVTDRLRKANSSKTHQHIYRDGLHLSGQLLKTRAMWPSALFSWNMKGNWDRMISVQPGIHRTILYIQFISLEISILYTV